MNDFINPVLSFAGICTLILGFAFTLWKVIMEKVLKREIGWKWVIIVMIVVDVALIGLFVLYLHSWTVEPK